MKLWLGTASLLLLFAAGCSEEPTAETRDIFRDDEGGTRRRQAKDDERLWTITMNGCTGHLIAPELMMTANHCRPQAGARYTSGYSINSRKGQDITVTRVEESSAQLDYAIMRIQWPQGKAQAQKFPPLVATQASDIAVSRNPNQGDELFTVGFPGDKLSSWGATYAEGNAKEVRGALLRYNIGIINGNSGGGVWRKRDKMLVSLTNGGPRILNQAGWNGNDTNDANAWNHGAAMWNVYAQSTILKDVFPNGKNRFVAAGTDAGAFLAIGSADRGAADTYYLLFAVPAGSRNVSYCESVAQCQNSSPGFNVGKYIADKNGMQIYRTATPINLRNRLNLSVVFASAEATTKTTFEFQQ
jgi:V8-like Glu-specific endopeptidase